MVRILARFRLAHPCAAPKLVMAHSRVHAIVVLTSMSQIDYMHSFPLICPDRRPTAAQGKVCKQLCVELIDSTPQEVQAALSTSTHSCATASAQSEAEARAAFAAPTLCRVFQSLQELHELSGYDSR